MSKIFKVAAAVVVPWLLWICGLSRGSEFIYSYVAGKEPSGSFTLAGLLGKLASSPSWLLGILTLVVPGLLTARNKKLQIFSLVVVSLYLFYIVFGSATALSWDPTAHLFALVAVLSVVFLVFKAPSLPPVVSKLTPVISLTLILLTQLFSPSVPDVSRDFMSSPRRDVSVVAGSACGSLDEYFTPQANHPGQIMVSGVCSKPAASVLHSVTKDGCYTREEAYRFLSILSGAYVDDPSQSEGYLQSRLTAAWIRGKDEIDNGFCVTSRVANRVFTDGHKPGGQTLFTTKE